MLRKERVNSLLTAEEVLACRALTKRFGTSYFLATQFFPREIREATYALYAFFRVPDEYVDNEKDVAVAEEKLRAWQEAWHMAYATGSSNDLVLSATAKVFIRYKIPAKLADDFLQAMRQDLTVDRYETYADLEKYMYGSASVVGLMMTYVIGFNDDRALNYAQRLGEAMQLTNFLRDIHEDWVERGRIYLPLEDLRRYSFTESSFIAGGTSPEFVDLMKFEIARARALYAEAEKGVLLLSPSGRIAVRLASRLYGEILREIEKRNYDVFAGRARTSSFTKLKLIFSIWLRK